MIVTDLKSVGDIEPVIVQNVAVDHAPPPYSLSHLPPDIGPNASSSSPFSPPIPTTSAANWVLVNRRNSTLKGIYVIDPALNVPEGMLPQLKRRQERKNLHLDTHNGNIKADVYLLGSGVLIPGQSMTSTQELLMKRPTTVDVTTHSGLISMKLNCDNGHPFNLHVSVHNGSISLALPRGFKGGLVLNTRHSRVTFSPSFGANVTTSSEMKGKRVYFVRHGNSSLDNLESLVDLHIHNGPVKICYADEVATDHHPEEKGFLSKLLGLEL